MYYAYAGSNLLWQLIESIPGMGRSKVDMQATVSSLVEVWNRHVDDAHIGNTDVGVGFRGVTVQTCNHGIAALFSGTSYDTSDDQGRLLFSVIDCSGIS